jgi:hypothetical protein
MELPVSKAEDPPSTKSDFYSLDEARNLIAKLLFGSDWDLKLTKSQQKLLADHGPTSKPLYEGSVLVGHVEVFDRPCPPDRRAEFEASIGRAHRIRIQNTTVDDWLVTFAGCPLSLVVHDVLRDPDDAYGKVTASIRAVIPRATLDEAIARYRAITATASTSPRGTQPILFQEMVKALRDKIVNGEVTEQKVRGMTQTALAKMLGVSRETAVKVRGAVLNTDKAENNSDKGRQSGE